MSVNILQGDVFDKLAELPDNHFDCVVTSPPYWGLRDYGVDGQIGLEPTMAEHIDVMVRVMAEIHRVLKPEGTVWFNYGDCYASTPNGRSAADVKAAGKDDRTFRDKPFSTIQGSLKPKDLTMMPNRIAIALQDWGWWVRSEIIWAKPNPMPESVTDRPASSHEKIFLLTKSARYFYDAEAVRQIATGDSHSRGTKLSPPSEDMAHGRKDWSKSIEAKAAKNAGRHHMGAALPEKESRDKKRGHIRPHAGFNDKWDGVSKAEQQAGGRNLRNWEPAPPEVWKMATRPFSEAHFATFPPELVERCLKAGCPQGGRVLDPFGGAGTTSLVADRMQMDCTLIELNPEYIKIADARLNGDRGGLLDAMEEDL